MKAETYYCTRLRIRDYLTSKHFLWYTTVPMRNEPLKTVWLYHYTPKLKAALEAYYAASRERLNGSEAGS